MKDKIKNGYFFIYCGKAHLRVGSRVYILPLENDQVVYTMLKNLKEELITAVFKPNGERVE